MRDAYDHGGGIATEKRWCGSWALGADVLAGTALSRREAGR